MYTKYNITASEHYLINTQPVGSSFNIKDISKTRLYDEITDILKRDPDVVTITIKKSK